jgi:hypothetical protein
VNRIQFTRALVDSGCRCYIIVNKSLVQALDLPRIKIRPRVLDGVVPNQYQITHATYFDLDVHGHQQGRVFTYIIRPQEDSMILGDPWLYDVRGRYSARKGYLDILTKTGERTRY